MEEVDMEGVGDAWGDDEGLDLGGDAEVEIGDEDLEGGLDGEDDDDEGGWAMEVGALLYGALL